jgi:signal transduction histidine kinase
LKPLKTWGIALQSPLKWLSNTLTERHFKREIEELSYDIEKRITESLAPIDEKTAPKEIRPLINAINRLISYFEDRSHHEQDFSANASHELRTPLAGIRLQTEIAMSTDDPEVQKKSHDNILKAVDQNERLIEQLLTLARLTADRVDLAMEKLDVGQLSSHVIANLQSLADEKQISLKLESRGNLALLASEESLSILLHNLIRNAINYTPEGGAVQVSATKSKGGVVLSVMDKGPGIAPDKYDMVLERFQKSQNNNKSGSGLGLAIVKRICDLHHATLTLDQTTRKGGLKVTVTFNR